MPHCPHQEGIACAECVGVALDRLLADVPAPVTAYSPRPDPADDEPLYLDINVPDPPMPVVPALSGRRVARSGEAAAGLVLGDKHALVSADAARAVAVIAGHLDSPERLRRVTHDRDYWKRIADDHETRAKATVGPLHEQHVENAADAKAWADFYGAILGLHMPKVAPKAPGENVP